MTNLSVQLPSNRMEQRTRILHHTRSKTPIILAPTSYAKPRQPASSSAPPRRHSKAPLASLDTEFSAVVRRLAKSRDYNGSRSSSTGRHIEGSRRIVSRDVLRSDQISDWSSDDENPSSPARSVPLRRHTMAATDRPWKRLDESSDNQSVSSLSRMSSPVDDTYLGSDSYFPKRGEDGIKWTINAREEAPTGRSLTLPRASQPTRSELSPDLNSSHVDFYSSNSANPMKTLSNTVAVSMVSTQNHAESSTVSSPNGSLNSDSPYHYAKYSFNGQTRQTLPVQPLQLQQHTIPTSMSSQITNRDSVNLASPATIHDHSFSVSSQQRSISHPSSSLNSHSSSQRSSPPITSPSNSNGTSPQTSTKFSNGNTWRTDPRRRPFQISGEFQLSPGDESREISPSAHSAAEGYSPPTLSNGVYTSPSSLKLKHSSPTMEKSSIRENGDCSFDSVHDQNDRLSRDVLQAEHRRHHDYPHNRHVNNGRTSNPPSPNCGHVNNCRTSNPPSPNCGHVNNCRTSNPPPPNCGHVKSPVHTFPDRIYSNATLESPRFYHSSTSPSSPCLERHNRSFDDRARSDIHQGTVNFSSPGFHRKGHTQCHAKSKTPNNHDHHFVQQAQENKSYSNAMKNSFKNNHKPFVAETHRPDPVCDYDFNQISKVTPPYTSHNSQYHPDRSLDYLEPYLGSRFSRNRDSYKLATDSGASISNFHYFTKELILAKNKRNSEYSVRAGAPETLSSRSGQNGDKPDNTILPVATSSANLQGNSFHNNFQKDDPFSAELVSEYFVRRSKQRDSYRIATSSNPDLTGIDQEEEEEVFTSCENIQSLYKPAIDISTSLQAATSTGKDQEKKSDLFLFTNEQLFNKNHNASRNNTHLKPNANNLNMTSRLKRNSLRIATASLSDLSVILDEIDISEPTDTTISNHDSAEHPSPATTLSSSTQSPLLERSLGRSGSSVSSRNSSFGSFYSCQSPAHASAKNSPNHVSCHLSPRDFKPSLGTPDSVHKLIMAKNAHDSGISQSSEDTNSYYISTNTSMCSAEDMEFGVNHIPVGESLNRKRPVFYWTRQSPYPRHTHNTIPASWKPKEIPQSRSTIARPPRHPKSSSIRSYGSSSSVESGSARTNQAKHNVPIPNHILQRYGCGLDTINPLPCGSKGSSESLTHRARHAKQQSSNQRRNPSDNHVNFQLPLPSSHVRRPDSLQIDFDLQTQSSDADTPTILESPNADTPRSPPSLGRPKRKLYAGFDSQPLPMDSFMSDSSSMISVSSRDTDMSGQPDSGNFDESFYSIDNRSMLEGCDPAFQASLTPQDFINLSEIHQNTQLHECRSNSLYSTSTAKEGDGEDSDNDGDEQVPAFQHQHSHHQVWPGPNYNQSVATSLPMTMTFSI